MPIHFIEVTLAHSFALFLSLLAVTVVVTADSFQFHTSTCIFFEEAIFGELSYALCMYGSKSHGILYDNSNGVL